MKEWHVVFIRWYVAHKVSVYIWYVVCCIGVVFTYAMQSHKNPVSASAMLTGKFLQIRKIFATFSLLAEEFSDTLQYKISRKYAKCPDELESFRTI